MSLFNDLEVTGYVFLPSTDALDQTTEYDADQTWLSGNADLTISINVLQLGVDELILFDDIGATHKANVDDTNAGSITRDSIIVAEGKRYKVVQRPKALKLFNGTYTLILRQTND